MATKPGLRPGEASEAWALDASATMPWFFPDEATPFTERLLDSLGAHAIWVPALWILECANVLQSAQKRKRIDSLRRAAIAAELAELPLRFDQELPDVVTIDRLAATHGLSAYDAAYLDLALRRSLTLVSLDARLVAAAQRLGHA